MAYGNQFSNFKPFVWLPATLQERQPDKEYPLVFEREDEMVKIVFPEGVTIEGTPDQIVEAAQKLGLDTSETQVPGYYNSTSRGFIPISEMNTVHIMNTLAKKQREYVDAAKKSREEFLEALSSWPPDDEFNALVIELEGRTD